MSELFDFGKITCFICKIPLIYIAVESYSTSESQPMDGVETSGLSEDVPMVDADELFELGETAANFGAQISYTL